MVLDNLGNSLKETLKKIARAVFVDEKLIDELVKDIQRALLSADVNVQLVFDLSKKIKDRAMKEKPPAGVNQREYIIKIVYEELVKFLGEEKSELSIEAKKPFKIMLLGLYGSGKCVHKKSKIALSDGDIVSAEELYSKYNKKETILEEGNIIDVSEEGIFVPSFNQNTLKIENKRVTHLWKLNGKVLLDVSLDNGNDFRVKVTPEHPFFVLRNGIVCMVRADNLNSDDFVAAPGNYNICGHNQNLFEDLKKLDLYVKDYYFDKSNKNIIRDIHPYLKFTKNYCKLTSDFKIGVTPIDLVYSFNQKNINLRHKGSEKFISFPINLDEELSEFLGYILGDGHLGKSYVEITTEDKEVVARVIYLSKKLFNLEVSIKKYSISKSLMRLLICSKTLVVIINKLFGIPIGKKGKYLRAPKRIIKSNETIIKTFLRAYFDCDASPEKGRGIELSSESHELIKDVALLLNRLGILSSISKKIINNMPYWRLHIRARYAEIYAEKIGFLIQHKKERVDNYKFIGKIQGCGKQDMLPLGNSLLELRESLGFSIGEIQEYVSSYGIYENKGLISKESLAKLIAVYTLKKKGRIAKLLEFFKMGENEYLFSNACINGFATLLKSNGFINHKNGQVALTDNAFGYLDNIGAKEELLNSFKLLIEADVCWLRVNNVEKVDYEDFVYDITVEDNHSFIADNIIVHNTTSMGKLAKYYSKRGYKIATMALDVHRPAAIDQLEQVSKQVNVFCFSDRKEKDPVKIYKKFESESKKYDLLIVDTAGRDALSHDLIEEIKNLNETIKPDENLLVINADIGQAARKQVEGFHNACKITGVIVTKLDGTAKGGGALTATAITGSKIKFIGVGEKPDDLEVFNPKGFVSRLLGMGDLELLLEKARGVVNEDDAEELSKKMLKGDFNFIDLYNQMQAMKKMGPLNKIMELIPGFGGMNIPKEMLDVQDEKLKKWKYIMDSCTKEELEDPDKIDENRMQRIAKGSGASAADIKELLKQYKQSKKMMKMMKGKDPSKLMQKFSKIGGLKF